MSWLTILALLIPMLQWLISLLGNTKPGGVPDGVRTKLATAAHLCQQAVYESARCGVPPEAGDTTVTLEAVGSVPTDVASMRVALSAGFDALLGLPRFVLTQDRRHMVYAQQAYWQAADDATIEKLLLLTPKTLTEERILA